MGRKKKEENQEESPVCVDDEIQSKFGEGVVTSFDFFENHPQKLISISPNNDWMYGGGIYTGSWMILNGIAKNGKTTKALHFAGNCQKEADMTVYFLGAEHRNKTRDFTGIRTLDTSPDKFKIVRSTKEHPLSAEKFIDIAEMILTTTENSVIILDSVSILCENAKILERGVKTRGGHGVIISDFCSSMATQGILTNRGHIFIGITHIIANTSGKGMSTTVEKTATALTYMFDFKAKTTWAEKWIAAGERIGQIVHWECLGTGTNQGPGRKCKSYLRYNYGLDYEAEVLDTAQSLGIVDGEKWLLYEKDDITLRANGFEKFCQALKLEENRHVYESIRKEIAETI